MARRRRAGTRRAIAAELEAAIAGAFATVLDLSANRTTLELAGPCARDVLATGCSIDLHPRAFGPARCAQTTVARTQVILDQVDDRPAFRLHVRGSFAATSPPGWPTRWASTRAA